MEDIHSESYVKGLFSEMAQTYGIVNILSSLGFAYLWRKQTVDSIPDSGSRICDLMTGGAECHSHKEKIWTQVSNTPRRLVREYVQACGHDRQAAKSRKLHYHQRQRFGPSSRKR